MQKITAVIVDDQIKSVNLLKHFIELYCSTIEIVGTALDVEDGIAIINEKQPRVIFLDILLGDRTSFEILEKKNYDEVKVVFVTAYHEYAIKTFQYNTVDYLLKPFSISDLKRVESKLNQDIIENKITLPEQVASTAHGLRNSHDIKFIAVSSSNRIDFIKFHELIYLKSERSYTTFYLSNNSNIIASLNIGSYEEVLERNSFYRIHKSYIVNLNYIKSIDKADGAKCIMDDDSSLPISRRKLKGLIDLFKND
ncbi:LytTR family DNA-binding domain-containing protein [Tenacibaculum tangerinum]|uniref:LytTR family DNA-binding domain-containing protein n=1 Tax=Tenacibaculum tangerinum TaxID=3038772 RepID=A0ABY8L614_9FLAO|nr:LytTR family DNA-binding domain-containing protein [Tenacibaculum tangerinum]WGH75479.1 LytTR family DNA-binding domain-containing protein [Tenacibaculum tangerinum]